MNGTEATAPESGGLCVSENASLTRASRNPERPGDRTGLAGARLVVVVADVERAVVGRNRRELALVRARAGAQRRGELRDGPELDELRGDVQLLHEATSGWLVVGACRSRIATYR